MDTVGIVGTVETLLYSRAGGESGGDASIEGD